MTDEGLSFKHQDGSVTRIAYSTQVQQQLEKQVRINNYLMVTLAVLLLLTVGFLMLIYFSSVPSNIATALWC